MCNVNFLHIQLSYIFTSSNIQVSIDDYRKINTGHNKDERYKGTNHTVKKQDKNINRTLDLIKELLSQSKVQVISSWIPR